MKNDERARRTRAALVGSARSLFSARPYADVSTDMVLEGAGVTRGALYHHFADKAALFEAVCVELSEEAVAAIASAVDGVDDPLAALESGSSAWLDFMLQEDVRRLLLVEAPTVLGWARWVALDEAHGFRLLHMGVEAAVAAGALHYSGDPAALAISLNGAMNAHALHAGASDTPRARKAAKAAVQALIRAFAPIAATTAPGRSR